ncbi:enoyl-CoA hydratase/isomerase family protein [Vreelandella venusta]|uniref:Enoyl-CoA hydratase/isomerase family protein n=1 Tax=Vreelandella venusta TaxID=44935 RepID=A0AAQ0CHC0_9GAMM|nr:enoyl-CoA hydratase/isomerase family protein [Halomonas venusta]QPI63782.1 enoyl-CoA hydratase/isomerase family protein [Halomonas venusta]QRL02977.1 enoyl-CoA hydratase/isomerase family protein [Halomonas venusta]WAM55306.1 enoyl-CoA hydratase/isomerase family protein [Halomonas venusta]GEK51780.1 crotonase [Halomonas venusta]
MSEHILTSKQGRVGVITLNRPEVLNAWHSEMRQQLIAALEELTNDDSLGAIVLTGAGERAFSAGQDLNETRSFDSERAKSWVGEWEMLYDKLRSSPKPIIAGLNGVAAGSAFQVALLCDFRIAHADVRMGQPEINSGIASTTGPWIMREHLGLARTIDLTLSGRLMNADESYALGLINRLVAADQVMAEALALGEELAGKPPVAMRLDRQRFQEITEPGFRDCLEAGVRIQGEAYASGEPARMMELFLKR